MKIKRKACHFSCFPCHENNDEEGPKKWIWFWCREQSDVPFGESFPWNPRLWWWMGWNSLNRIYSIDSCSTFRENQPEGCEKGKRIVKWLNKEINEQVFHHKINYEWKMCRKFFLCHKNDKTSSLVNDELKIISFVFHRDTSHHRQAHPTQYPSTKKIDEEYQSNICRPGLSRSCFVAWHFCHHHNLLAFKAFVNIYIGLVECN